MSVLINIHPVSSALADNIIRHLVESCRGGVACMILLYSLYIYIYIYIHVETMVFDKQGITKTATIRNSDIQKYGKSIYLTVGKMVDDTLVFNN